MTKKQRMNLDSLNFPLRVFVYGTLKKGESNHICMAEARATFICRAKTKAFRKLVCNGLPYLHDGDDPSGYQVEGEIYEIPDSAGLAVLDRLEGNGRFYNRRVDEFIDCDAEESGLDRELPAWVYYIMHPKSGNPCKAYTGRVLSAMTTWGEGF